MSGRDKKRNKRARKRSDQQKRRLRKRLGDDRAKLLGGQPTRLRADIDRAELGRRGIPSIIHLVPQFDEPGDREARDRALLGASGIREFKVIAHLTRAHTVAQSDLDLQFDVLHGSSLLKLPARLRDVKVKTPSIEVTLRANERGEVAALEFLCQATSPGDVLRIFGERVAPILDEASFAADIPVLVRALSWNDGRGVMGATFVAPYPEVSVEALGGLIAPDLQPLYSLYREAISNPSVFYQFLCFVKILEGANKTKTALWVRANNVGLSLTEMRSAVPNLDRMVSSAEACAWTGQSIWKAHQDYLLPRFRVAVAHFSAERAEPLVLSRGDAIEQYEQNLELARACARQAIQVVADLVRQLI